MTAPEASRTPDHFSAVAAPYAEFRPRYPTELFDFVASLAPRRHRAWDCGAGSGQATSDLAERFDEVIASDLSAEQVASAAPRTNVRWLVAPAESTPIEASSVDLVAVAQALHWFDHARFYDEVRRVASPGGAIAAWSYGIPAMEGDAGAVLRRLMLETLHGYWPRGREHVEQNYRTIPFPFERIAAPDFRLEQRWTLDQVVGYMRSWSATARFTKANGVDPVVDAERELRAHWTDAATPRRIEWPLALLVGRALSKAGSGSSRLS